MEIATLVNVDGSVVFNPFSDKDIDDLLKKELVSQGQGQGQEQGQQGQI